MVTQAIQILLQVVVVVLLLQVVSLVEQLVEQVVTGKISLVGILRLVRPHSMFALAVVVVAQ
jgi:hypothetical protein